MNKPLRLPCVSSFASLHCTWPTYGGGPAKTSITKVCTEHTRLSTMLGLKTTANASLFLFCFSFGFQVSGWFPMSYVVKDNLEYMILLSLECWDETYMYHHLYMWYWGLTPRLPACYVSTLPTALHLQPIFTFFVVLGFHFALSSVSWIASP